MKLNQLTPTTVTHELTKPHPQHVLKKNRGSQDTGLGSIGKGGIPGIPGITGSMGGMGIGVMGPGSAMGIASVGDVPAENMGKFSPENSHGNGNGKTPKCMNPFGKCGMFQCHVSFRRFYLFFWGGGGK